MGGGYGNQFSQYQALPTNLQNYTGGTGSPSLMNQSGPGSARQAFSTTMPQQNPFAGRSPYQFMGGMGRNFGGPPQAQGDYNSMAQGMFNTAGGGMTQLPNYRSQVDHFKKLNQKMLALQAQLEDFRRIRDQQSGDPSDIRGGGTGAAPGGNGPGGSPGSSGPASGPHGGE